MKKILITTFRPLKKEELIYLLELLNTNFNPLQIGIATIEQNEQICTQIAPNATLHIAWDENSSQKFHKRVFNEVKTIFRIKKQKYDIAVQLCGSKRGIIIPKYAKIKTIVGFETKDKKINKLITHKITTSVSPEQILKTLANA
ncbi:hypothetical protein [Campylobacter suis]|uniref:Uncharacterized protein n=1 Tax=Campylobacter suis TaxID=2790657 RepID=A0ABN7K8J2_9BACT|nr:hypothetical protein [Campylobacter suis]CAD7288755.1 hypothetical protein LMG8286_01504 [Campylobacter suis]